LKIARGRARRGGGGKQEGGGGEKKGEEEGENVLQKYSLSRHDLWISAGREEKERRGVSPVSKSQKKREKWERGWDKGRVKVRARMRGG
jgi:hypothetical protein